MCQTVPDQAPYHALISNHPSSFPASFNPSHCLHFAAFSWFHPNVLTLVSLGLSGSYALTLDLTSTAPLPTHASHASTMASPLTPSTSQCPVKWVLLSSFHSFHCLTSFMPPFKPHPAAIPCVAGHHLTPLVLTSSTIQLPSNVSLALPQPLQKTLTCSM